MMCQHIFINYLPMKVRLKVVNSSRHFSKILIFCNMTKTLKSKMNFIFRYNTKRKKDIPKRYIIILGVIQIIRDTPGGGGVNKM